MPIRRCHAKSVAWANRVIFPGFIMWATVLWLIGCLASLDGPLVTNLWVQCETLELRFLKCSIKWDVLTFCFCPVSASLLHSFYSLENTTLSIAYIYSRSLSARRYAPQFSNHGPAGPCLIAFLAPDAWGSWLCRNVRCWARYSPDGGGSNLACTRRGTRFWTCHWLLLPPLPHLCDLFIDHVEFHENARRISGLGTRCRSGQPSLILGVRLTRAFLRLNFWTPLPYDSFRQILGWASRTFSLRWCWSCSGLSVLTTPTTTCWTMRILWRFPHYHCCGNQFCSWQGRVVVVVMVVVVHNLVAMWLLSMLSPLLPHDASEIELNECIRLSSTFLIKSSFTFCFWKAWKKSWYGDKPDSKRQGRNILNCIKVAYIAQRVQHSKMLLH